MSSEKRNYCIAELNIGLRWPESLTVAEIKGFPQFETDDVQADVRVTLTEAEEISVPSGSEVYSTSEVSVYKDMECYMKLLRGASGLPYAKVQCNWENKSFSVQYLPGAEEFLGDISNIFRCVGFEGIMMSRKRLLLHSSLVETASGGLLFSGASGIGKSTQADLWHRYEGSQIINGDRPILYRREDGWMSSGSPYAGSSGYYVNRSLPVFAIVLLEQGKTCDLHRLGEVEAFRRLYAGTVVNTWNREFVNRTCDLLADLVAEVPVYAFRCTPDQKAVEYLKMELF